MSTWTSLFSSSYFSVHLSFSLKARLQSVLWFIQLIPKQRRWKIYSIFYGSMIVPMCATSRTFMIIRAHTEDAFGKKKRKRIIIYLHIFIGSYRRWKWVDCQLCCFLQWSYMKRKKKNRPFWNYITSSCNAGAMPMVALREQLDRASLLFLMCSRYTAMS